MRNTGNNELVGRGCDPVRTTLRVVGFKVADHNPSPTSVLATCLSGQSSSESPRSQLAEALKGDSFRPLPRLRIKPTPRSQSAGFRRSRSHADLQHRDVSLHLDRSEPATPGSRTSTSSTPMQIPSAMARVHTCPIEFTTMENGTYLATINLPGTLPAAGSRPGSHHSQHSRHPSQIEEGRSFKEDNESLVRTLFPPAPVEITIGLDRAPQQATNGGVDALQMQLGDMGVRDIDAGCEEGAVFSMDAPRQLKLRLPAAAVHRRIRSLEGLPPRN